MPAPEVLASALRFAYGDLLVKLSPDGTLDVLISKAVVAKSCPTLAFCLRTIADPQYISWLDSSVPAQLPDSPHSIDLSTLALRFVDGTLLLEGTEFDGVPEHVLCRSFDHSCLSIPGWPQHTFSSEQYGNTSNVLVACQYLVLFKILHKQDFSLDDLEPWYDSVDKDNIERYLDQVSELCARAEYLGCLPLIAKVLTSKLSSCPFFWETMGSNPFNRMLLGEKLRSKEIYFDAFRHFTASSHGKKEKLAGLSDFLGMSLASFSSLNQSMRVQQAIVIEDLLKKLRQMALPKSNTRPSDRQSTHTIFLNKGKPDIESFSNSQKNAAKAEFLARAHWAEYYTQQEMDYYIATDYGDGRGRLRKALAEIEESTADGSGHLVFGATAVTGLATTFNLKEDSINQLTHFLGQIVRVADAKIKRAFKTKEVISAQGVSVIWRRARFDVNEDYWTYLPYDENDVPWETDPVWEEATLQRGTFDSTPATTAQLQTLGIVTASETNPEELKVDWGAAMPPASAIPPPVADDTEDANGPEEKERPAIREIADVQPGQDMQNIKPFSEW
ncbi:hypothetical protein M409DRAFT_22287 [Zasmidium cellare ATCC 36951]|uniref:Uncharacterized protein n=1 Tax=Zasmidium cellare ATCC 36951 TaxID=1080233 RepID=A0A6A6CP07_ZASCE|nr:uncharacterized protein M409DRAFT_22287 [Zasmidium cellare ATCC 36951]KAF2167479.1 hypothetical protein M409DRAFT_22287 [Zasmidium cellare ATCC 36951]